MKRSRERHTLGATEEDGVATGGDREAEGDAEGGLAYAKGQIRRQIHKPSEELERAREEEEVIFIFIHEEILKING